MRGLFNLSTKKRSNKTKIISELEYEFGLLKVDKLDAIIKSYLVMLLKIN